MTVNESLRVMVLHNHDNSWDANDMQEAVDELRGMTSALEAHGCEVRTAQVFHSVQAALQDSGCDPRQWLVFNWCEGYADRPWDYAGVTDELDQMQYVYTGASSWTLRMTEDKQLSRALLQEAGVPLPEGIVVHTPREMCWDMYPAIVKPVNQHGSYGIDREAVVRDEQELRRRIEYVRDTFNSAALIEEFIEGREFHMTVWGNALTVVLPAVEIVYNSIADPRDQVMTYDLKFDMTAVLEQRLRFICPPMLTVAARQRLKVVCEQAYRALRNRDYARLDVRMRGEEPYVIDINPNPDINSESMVSMAAQAEGLSHGEMIMQIVDFAAERGLHAGLPSILSARAQAALNRLQQLQAAVNH
jgi:D-alanine-D-alanine ligase